MIFYLLIFHFLLFDFLLFTSFFFSDFTFYKEALCFIIFILSLFSNTLTLENIFEYYVKNKKNTHFKISSQDEVFTCLFFFFSSWDEISSRQKRVNSKRHFTIDRDDFIPGRVSSQDEILRVNTLRDTVKPKNWFFPLFLITQRKLALTRCMRKHT